MPRILIAALAAASVFAGPVAFAEGRMNDVEYLQAVRCLAYVAGADSQIIDGDALADEVREQGHNRERYIRERARREGRSILRTADRIDSDPEWDDFERQLRTACEGFEPMIAGLNPRA